MLKSVIKEVFIILLLSIAILLVLGILFYDYIPTNRVVPTKKAYSTPEEVKNEIEEEVTETEKIEVSYEVTDADLNIYKQTGSYTEGKANPFILGSTTNETNDKNGYASYRVFGSKKFENNINGVNISTNMYINIWCILFYCFHNTAS